ncbi:MAG: hypothetical protein ABIK79_06140 [Chloroflexota bacterium]|nr:hypothetical protein [Anaerolineae bacterium]
MDSVSVSPEDKKHQPEEHLPEQAVLETDPAPPVHGGAQRSDAVCTQERTGLKIRCWMQAQHRV